MDNLSFMVGAFYEDSTQFFEAEQFNAFPQAVAGILMGPPLPVTTVDFEDALYDVKKAHTTDSEINAYFASVDWSITDSLTFSGGMRYTEVEREGIIEVPFINDNLLFLSTLDPRFTGVPNTVLNGTFTTPVIQYEDDDTNIEATLDYEFVDGQHVYFAYKEAFKPGGIDNSVTAWGPTIASLDSEGVGVVFEGEEVDGFEIGYKGQMLDDTLRINGVFYNYDYSDFQVQSFSASTLGFVTTNAGEVSSQGVEVEFDYLPGIDGLALFGTLAWDNSEFDEYIDPVTRHDLSGRRLGQVAEFSGTVGANYQNTLGDSGWTYDLGYSMRFTGEYFLGNQYSGTCSAGAPPTCSELFKGEQQDGYEAHDIRIGLTSPNEQWNLSLIANNVTDEFYAIASAGVAPNATDDQQVIRNEGRTVTIQLGAKF